jgi:hypothetical protein
VRNLSRERSPLPEGLFEFISYSPPRHNDTDRQHGSKREFQSVLPEPVSRTSKGYQRSRKPGCRSEYLQPFGRRGCQHGGRRRRALGIETLKQPTQPKKATSKNRRCGRLVSKKWRVMEFFNSLVPDYTTASSPQDPLVRSEYLAPPNGDDETLL